ncbi:MAG: DNA double-strand break repair nuclease NurA [Rhabdochlamydiaceae bacterium]
MMTNQLNLLSSKNSSNQLFDLESLTGDLDSSLANLAGKKVFFRSDFSKEVIPLQNLESVSRASPYPLQTFALQPRERQVVAIDSSCALIGETEDGSIFAGRVAIVSSLKTQVRTYYRAGPFIFYMDQKSLAQELSSRLSRRAIRAILSDNSLAERFIRMRLERTAQIHAAKTNNDSIILIDGAIKSSILETHAFCLRELERTADENFNQLIGFSKTSSLRLVSSAAGMLQSVGRAGNFFDITDSLKVFMVNLEGRVLVARFSPNSQVFRVDMSKTNAEEDSQVLADLRFNDVFFRGYAETLRLAHHLSVFDSSTISSTRSYLSKKYGMIHVASDDLRATILGRLV